MKPLYLAIALLLAPLVSDARKTPSVKQPVQSKFRAELFGIVNTSAKPDGFEAMKQVELTTGRWACRKELEGFLPVVEVNGQHPADRLQVYAVSVTPAAQKNVKMLLLQGLPGYDMRDSDKDKSVPVDRSKYSRKVVFHKTDKFVESTITVAFNAHQYNSVELLVEAWQAPL